MKTESTTLVFTSDGRFHCDGLAQLFPGLRSVRIGGGLREGEHGCEECPKFARCGMSHTAEIKTTVTDVAAINAACKELGIEIPKIETVMLFDGQEHTGLAVRLKGWSYPVVINTKTGAMHYDNYAGKWGEQKELNRFTQLYGVAKATLIAKQKGYFVQRSTLPNGSIKLMVTGMK